MASRSCLNLVRPTSSTSPILNTINNGDVTRLGEISSPAILCQESLTLNLMHLQSMDMNNFPNFTPPAEIARGVRSIVTSG